MFYGSLKEGDNGDNGERLDGHIGGEGYLNSE